MTAFESGMALRDGRPRVASRRSFARIEDVLPVPALIRMQVESFKWFQEEGIRELFHEISPITSFNDNLELHFPGYDEKLNEEFGLGFRFEEPQYSQDECRTRDATYAAPLYVKVLLYNKENDQPVVQDVYMGDYPIMTETGTFIVNGAERVVVSQLIRSPGAYFTVDEDLRTGRQLCNVKLIPNRGAWLEFETGKRDVLAVKVDRKRRIPVTILLRALGAVSDGRDDFDLGDLSDEWLIEYFAEVDDDPDRQLIATTLESISDHPKTPEEALLDFYHRMRPGDPVTLDNARSYLVSLLFDPRRYDLAKVGRYKLNRRLGIEPELPIKQRTVTKQDLFAVLWHMIKVNNGAEGADDIDHLGNRRVKTVGELIQNQLRVGFLRMERVVRERMSIRDPEQVSPISLINIRPVVAVMREFFGGSQLSQFMGQTNPLDELTHKRTLSALGPGGLRRERAGFDVRDVHYSHYGRICPIETPEGPNIGLIGRLATFAQVNPYGFIETPYRKVAKEIASAPEGLVGHELRQRVIDPDTGEVIADRGQVIDEELAAKLATLDEPTFRVRPYVTEKVEYLSADEEEHYVVAQANAPIDDLGQFVHDRVSVRYYDTFLIETVDNVDYMDVSPKQIVGVSAALIPFLEHDDANRALMGSNMQRQAVPLVVPRAPVVGTGMERQAALDSGQVLLAEKPGRVTAVSSERVEIAADDGEEITYRLRQFNRSNQSTCIHQRPVVRRGQRVEVGDVIADSSSTEQGELALGQNVMAAFMSWGGGNYEDAILVSEQLVRSDRFTSVHLEKHEVQARETKLGPEEITRDIPNVGEEALRNLDEDGVIYVGAEVGPGDILVGKITPKGETELTPEEKLLRAIFGEKAREVKDSSLRLPHGEEGTVVDVHVFTREDHRDLPAGVEKLVRVTVAQRRKITEGDKMAGRHGNKGVISQVVPIEDMPYLEDGTAVEVILNPLGVPARMNVGQVLETHLGWAADRLGLRMATPVSDGATEDEIAAELARAWLIDRAWKDLTERAWAWLQADGQDDGSLQNDQEARELFLGNYLYDQGRSPAEIDVALVDEGSARRAWLACWLGEMGHDVAGVLAYEDSPPLEQRGAMDELARKLCLTIWLGDHGIEVGDASFEEITKMALEQSQKRGDPLPTSGKMVVYDGKTGRRFDRPVTVGIIYMLKLAHLVQDKVHARSTGPYSLVTQQPLGGKAQFGGQRFGEMEVWALEAYGAAHTLQEMLTVKSDDVTGRVKTYEAIVKGEPIPGAGVPESFNVLVKELQALGLAVDVYNDKGESINLVHDDQMVPMPKFGRGMGFGPTS
ncbi:MAG: DNA-directed RNA polymerase subunit beta [Anaerolineae bacterium]